MIGQQDNCQYQEKRCPKCCSELILTKNNQLYCQYCALYFTEQICCPLCDAKVECIRGCGSVNYLCHKDGLISKKNIRYYYLPTE